jgi:hypothetical protein
LISLKVESELRQYKIPQAKISIQCLYHREYILDMIFDIDTIAGSCGLRKYFGISIENEGKPVCKTC